MQLIWASLQGGGGSRGGPLAKVQKALKSLGWVWTSLKEVATECGQVLDIAAVTQGQWQHEVREALRMMLWRRAASRRRDMQGIQDGIDREATLALLKSKGFDGQSKGMLRSIMAGAFWTCKRLAHTKVLEDDTCPFCSLGEVEDECHLWWTCPAWKHVREQHSFALQAYSNECGWPQCLKCCGLMPAELPGIETTLAYAAIDASDTDNEEED
eukprot:3266111-Karenia_brevis.AAC.1